MPDEPTYQELVTMLRQAPARQGIGDPRYWQWSLLKDALLDRVSRDT